MGRKQGWDSVGTEKYAESTPGRLTPAAGRYMYVHSWVISIGFICSN